jgi:hypothetical protein
MRLSDSIFISLALFVACKDDSVGPVDQGEIWPLTPGNVWLYRVEHPTWIKDTLKMEITGSLPVVFQGEKYTAMKMAFYGLNEPQPEWEWLYWNGPEGVYAMGGVSPTDTFVVKELELRYPAAVGDKWRYHSVSYSLSRRKFYISDTLIYSLVAKDVAVVTPAGSFRCYQYRFSQKPADDVGAIWDYNFYYSLGNGHVAEKTISQLDGGTKDEYVLLSDQLY